LEPRIEWRIENRQPSRLAFLDLNHFKLVNDRLGHAPGDALLKQFSEELKSNLRPGDLGALGRRRVRDSVGLQSRDCAGDD